MLKDENWMKNSLTSLEPRTKFSVLHCIRIPFLMRCFFLTIDPFVRISVFIAKLSKRQDCRRTPEDFHSQDFIQFFDVHCGLFLRLHFSIGGYDFRRTARLRQGIHFSNIQVLFAEHMHRRAGVVDKLSFLGFLIWCRKAPIFRRWEECCFVFPFILIHFWPASTLLHGHIALSWDRSSNFGALGIRWWGSPGANHSERRILVSNVSMTYDGFSELNTSDWFPYVWALPQNRWRFRRLHILTYANQLSCTFQQSHCTFLTILFRPFARLFFNLAMRIRALLPQICIHSPTCRTSILVDAIFHRMEWCKFLWGNPCTAVEPYSYLGFCV